MLTIPLISKLVERARTVRSDRTLVMLTGAGLDEAKWDNIVKTLHGSFLHSFAWSRYIAGPHGNPAYFVIQNSGETVAAGWYIMCGKTIGPIKIIKQLQMETLPCYDPDKISGADVFREVQFMAERKMCASFSFGNSSQEYGIENMQDTINEKISFYVDLQHTVKELYSNLQEKHRKKIQKAAKSALVVKYFTNERDFALSRELGDMFEYTFCKHLSAGKERHRQELCSITDITRELLLAGNAVIFVAFFENVPVSCYIVSTFDRQAYNIYGASNAKGYELNASFLLIWRIIEYFKERDYLVLNLGEVFKSSENESDLNHGLYRHKSGFGAKTRVLYSGSVVLSPITDTILKVVRKWKAAASARGRLLAGR